MVKCPACGFDSQDGARWCDFCKEPFRQTQEPKAPAPAPQSPPAAADKPKDPWAALPPEVFSMDSGGKVPVLPAWARYTAWSFLALAIITFGVLISAILARQNAQEEDAAIQRRFDSQRSP